MEQPRYEHEIFRGVDGRYLAARICDIVCYFYVNQDSDDNQRAFQSTLDDYRRRYPE